MHPFLSLSEKIPGEREVGAKLDQFRNQLRGAPKGVKQESTVRSVCCPEGIEERTPCLEAVDREWKVMCRRESKLGNKYIFLLLEMWIVHPAIEAALADKNTALFPDDYGGEPLKPFLTTDGNIPRMKTN